MERVFIDTNAIIELFRNNEGVREFFRKVEDGEIAGLANVVVFLETLHVYAILKTDQGPMNLKKRPSMLKSIDLSPVLRFFTILKILPVNSISMEDIVEIIGEYGLLPNDALIAATCRHYGIRKIATFDEDFRRVDFLEVVEP